MIQIRPAEARDIAQIRRVAAESWRATYSGIFSSQYIDDFIARAYAAEGLSLSLADPDSVFLVAASEDAIVGFCHFATGERGPELLRLYILPPFWRMGIGTRLLESGEGKLRTRGVKEYGCYVHAKNERAQQFYVAHGFRHAPELDNTEDWWMSRTL